MNHPNKTALVNEHIVDEDKSEDMFERMADEHFNPGRYARCGTMRIGKTDRPKSVMFLQRKFSNEKTMELLSPYIPNNN